ncbi:hypothetical protein Pla100_49360 [Neorhodopirellula pilleata]|uniref:Uncharacterized protein n=1 Tax=Neorhodopirellula pilleata TaxID=2714738 RepID=A0A5C5ZXM9_9BACT|nr:hypothetical protein Pla100_49360 [Neorhodopirellula pilleata]
MNAKLYAGARGGDFQSPIFETATESRRHAQKTLLIDLALRRNKLRRNSLAEVCEICTGTIGLVG